MTEESKGAAVALPEPDGFMDQSLGGFPAYSADAMLAFRAEGEADLRARLAAAEAEVVRLRAQRGEAVAALGRMVEAYFAARAALASLKEQAA